MKFNRVDHIAIIVTDLEQAKNFYVEKLGFTIIREICRHDRNDTILNLQIGNEPDAQRLEIFVEKNSPARVTNPEACGLRHLAFRVDDVEDTVAELEKKGIQCEPIRIDPYTHGKMTFFRDPDGLPLEIRE